MKKKVLILIVLLYAIAFPSPQIGNDKTAKDSALVEQLVSILTSILHGNDYSEFRENISPEAYVIHNSKYESIFEVLENPAKRESFIEVKETIVSFVHLGMPDDKNCAYMVLETKSADNTKTNWHSSSLNLGKTRSIK